MIRIRVLYVVANVYSKVHSNIQRQNLHQLLTCRIRPDADRPASEHHLFSRQPGAWSSRRVAWTGAQTPIRVAGTRVAAAFIEQIQEWVEKARRKNRGASPPEEDRSRST